MTKGKEREIVEEFLRGIQGPQPMEHESKRLLSGLGIPVPKGVFIPKENISQKEVFLKTAPLGFPLVAKTASPAFRAKTEAGAIRLRLEKKEQAMEAARELAGIEGAKGVLIEQMIEGGTEAIVGGLMDAQFGPVVAFGLGGIFAEVFRDVSFALAPVNEKEALRLATRIKGKELLFGIRGRPPADLKALSAAIATVSRLIATGLIKEIDLNPLALFPSGAFALDAKIFV